MTFAIVTFYDEALAEIGDLTSATAEDYARHNGYLFKRYRTQIDPRVHTYWNKILILIEELHRADYVLWVDADALVVGQHRLEDIAGTSNLAISTDKDGVCCGVMLLKSSVWTMNLLQAWSFLDEVDESQLQRYEARRLHDQSTLKCLMANFPKVRAGITLLPDRIVLNPRAPYHQSPFIMHYWSSSGRLGDIVAKINSFKQHGWTRDSYLEWVE